MTSSWQDRISEVTRDEITDLIKAVSPDNETYFGKQFLFSLLGKRGLRATLQFIKDAKLAIEDYGGLDLNFNFDPDDRKTFWKTHLKYWRLNEFCEVFGWSIPGAFYFGVKGVIKTVIVFNNLVHNNYDDLFNQGGLEGLYNQLVEFGEPPIETLIGLALFRAGLKNRKEIGLEQLKDTINELSKEIPKLLEEKAARTVAA